MGLDIKEFIIFTLPSGQEIKIDATTPAKKTSEFKFACDGPHCAVFFDWTEEDAKADPFIIPDAVWRIISVGPDIEGQNRKMFCSRSCLRDHFRNYVEPLSPREQEEIRKHNEAVDAAKETKIGPDFMDSTLPKKGCLE